MSTPTWTHIHYLHNSAKASLDDFSDGLLAVFVGQSDSRLLTAQLAAYRDVTAKENPKGLEIVFVSTDAGETDSPRVLVDPQRELLNLDPELAKRDTLEPHLFVLRKHKGELSLLLSRKHPHFEQNWIEYLHGLIRNYKNAKPDEDNTWRVAQVVPKTGEYLCIDCGYIEEFKAGGLFPVCEVCLSGDPDGPSALEKGYWEYLG